MLLLPYSIEADGRRRCTKLFLVFLSPAQYWCSTTMGWFSLASKSFTPRAQKHKEPPADPATCSMLPKNGIFQAIIVCPIEIGRTGHGKGESYANKQLTVKTK